MKKMKLLATLLTLLAGVTAHAVDAVQLTAEDLNSWLDGYLPYALATGDIAGAVVVVVKDGKIVSERGFGFSDVDKRTPVDPKLTLFRPGSVSKLVTWTAVMQQVEAGKIDLDADVNQYLDFKIPARDGKPVTMRNLMQHTAGFEEQSKDIIREDPAGPKYDALLKRWTPTRVFDPGVTPAYSNYGASLAGYIVQRVSGENFDDYLDKHVFGPLDMPHSTFRQPLPKELEPLMSKGYSRASEPAKKFEIIGPAPAGSLSSPGEDMGHFMIAHLQDGEYNGKRILKAETARQMHDSPLTLLPPLNRMELGFFETNINGREVIAHLGDTSSFHTSLHLFLKENTGFYVSFNSLGRDGAVQGLRNAMFADFADRYFPGERSTERVDEAASKQHAALLTGHWVNSRASQSSFIAALDLVGQSKLALDDKGALVAPFLGLNGKPRKWVETKPFLWEDLNSHERLAAKVENGRAVRFSIDEISPFMVFYRPAWYQNSAWLLPLFVAGVAALLLTVIIWPVAAIVRRRYGARLVLPPAALRAYRWSRIGALAIVLGLTFWAVTLASMITDIKNLSAAFDGRVHMAQLFGVLTLVGGMIAMLWNLKYAFAPQRRWPAKVWSVMLVVSAAAALWVAVVFNLIGFGVNY